MNTEESKTEEIVLEDMPTNTYKTSDGYCLSVLEKFDRDLNQTENVEDFVKKTSFQELFSKYDLKSYLHNVRGAAVFNEKRKGGIYSVKGKILDENNPEHKKIVDKIKSREEVRETYDEIAAEK